MEWGLPDKKQVGNRQEIGGHTFTSWTSGVPGGAGEGRRDPDTPGFLASSSSPKEPQGCDSGHPSLWPFARVPGTHTSSGVKTWVATPMPWCKLPHVLWSWGGPQRVSPEPHTGRKGQLPPWLPAWLPSEAAVTWPRCQAGERPPPPLAPPLPAGVSASSRWAVMCPGARGLGQGSARPRHSADLQECSAEPPGRNVALPGPELPRGWVGGEGMGAPRCPEVAFSTLGLQGSGRASSSPARLSAPPALRV